jgi:hypothetical protein
VREEGDNERIGRREVETDRRKGDSEKEMKRERKGRDREE